MSKKKSDKKSQRNDKQKNQILKPEAKNFRQNKNWTDAEDQLLVNLISLLGCKWKFVSRYFPNHSLMQVYNRYNQINPSYKRGRFTLDEDKMIIDLVEKFSYDWAKISRMIKTRSPKQIRNRYKNRLTKAYNYSEISKEDKQKIRKLHPLLKRNYGLYNNYLNIKRSPNFIKNILKGGKQEM